MAREDVFGKSAGPAGLGEAGRPAASAQHVSETCNLHNFLRLDSKLGEPNVQFDHLDVLFNIAMSNLAFDNVYNGVILYPCFTILVDAPISVVSCIFWA